MHTQQFVSLSQTISVIITSIFPFRPSKNLRNRYFYLFVVEWVLIVLCSHQQKRKTYFAIFITTKEVSQSAGIRERTWKILGRPSEMPSIRSFTYNFSNRFFFLSVELRICTVTMVENVHTYVIWMRKKWGNGEQQHQSIKCFFFIIAVTIVKIDLLACRNRCKIWKVFVAHSTITWASVARWRLEPNRYQCPSNTDAEPFAKIDNVYVYNN